ncbi:hypothetical protein [Streptomyces lonarensis]|uniref:Lantibiotic n=1 Tax=Streptomyces lonarensis TaxID=700599 RepID=A0A7X6HXF7_9ACTN|nr:hypothetical protein [Streptomyces lonarensis]NJQ04483.1 hypothetical protein [Streptomyces lonarensis]
MNSEIQAPIETSIDALQQLPSFNETGPGVCEQTCNGGFTCLVTVYPTQ